MTAGVARMVCSVNRTMKDLGEKDNQYNRIHFALYTRITRNLRILNLMCAPMTYAGGKPINIPMR